jgi:hypothetical protein
MSKNLSVKNNKQKDSANVKESLKDALKVETKQLKKVEAKVDPKVGPKVDPKVEADDGDGEVKFKTKSDKLKNVDKGEKANKETAFVGLEINVKPFRGWVKSYFDLHGYESMRCINVHYMLATVDQILIFSLLHSMSDGFKKSKNGMYELSVETMMERIKLTPHLNSTFGLAVQKFDSSLDYSKQLCITNKEFNDYVNKFVFNDNFRINMNKEATNFLKYLLVQANIMLVNTSIIISETANKSLSATTLVGAIKIHFSGKLLDDILKKADGIISLLKNKEKQDSEKDETKDSNDDNNNEDKEEEEEEDEDIDVDKEDDDSDEE